MKEETVRKKWCPFVRIIIGPDDSTWQDRAVTNRCDIVKDGFNEVSCIGSDCMAWYATSEGNGDCMLIDRSLGVKP